MLHKQNHMWRICEWKSNVILLLESKEIYYLPVLLFKLWLLKCNYFGINKLGNRLQPQDSESSLAF